MKQHLLKIALLAIAALIAACGAQSQNTPTPTAAPKDSISVQLSWTHEYWGAGFYLAEQDGHFAEQNLDVSLIQGGFGPNGYIEPIDEVLNGNGDFGLGSVSSLLKAREEGKPVVAVATLLQRSPFALISLSDQGIQQPQDLVGKTVTVADGGATMVYNAMLASQGIDASQVTTVPRTTFGIEPLVNGDVDVLAGWIINEGVMVREAGKEPQYILFSDYGFDTYDILIFTSEDTVKNRPDVVERFLRATFAGMQDVIADPNKAAEAVLSYNDQLTLDGQLARLEASLALFNPSGSKPGMMQAKVWEFNQQLLLDNGELSKPVDLDTVYTLQFLNKIHGS